MKKTLILDTECYTNYWLLKFRNRETGNMKSFPLLVGGKLDIEGIKKILRQYRVVSFNGINYDIPMITLALSGADCATLKKASDAIIVTGLKPWHIESNFNISIPRNLDHIDIIEVCPGVASLKMYSGRLHCQKMQDLPIEPQAILTPAEIDSIDLYCGNDLINTDNLFESVKSQIALRERMTGVYGEDLRSKSDAQIAEAVIKSAITKITGEKITKPRIEPGTIFKYHKPKYIAYKTPILQTILKMVLENDYVLSDGGKMLLPKELSDAKIKIGNSVYRMGIGGLHSSEKAITHIADENTILVDRDVASYYPTLILNLGLYPKHLGDGFRQVYKKILDERLVAKRRAAELVGEIKRLEKEMPNKTALLKKLDDLKNELALCKTENEVKKIVLNGSFGKFGSKYSILFSPDLLIQTTLTGQLALLMLIEAFELAGIPVVSANTDGIVMACPKNQFAQMEVIIADWEFTTNFETEATYYKSLHSRDVNNYIAVKSTGGYKSKGEYAPAGLQKNPSNEICSQAVAEFLVNGTPVEKTIRECKDVRKFVSVRQVNGGAIKGDAYLGKAIRWYYANGVTTAIHYKINGNKVPRSDGAKPMMDLPDTFPTDINYRWYITEANAMLADMGSTMDVLNPDLADLI